MSRYIMTAAGKQPTVSAVFSMCKIAQGNSSVIIQVDSDSNDEVEYKETLSDKSLTWLSCTKSIN